MYLVLILVCLGFAQEAAADFRCFVFDGTNATYDINLKNVGSSKFEGGITNLRTNERLPFTYIEGCEVRRPGPSGVVDCKVDGREGAYFATLTKSGVDYIVDYYYQAQDGKKNVMINSQYCYIIGGDLP